MPISLLGLVVAAGIVLALLYPKQRISEQIQMDTRVDEFSLQYLRNVLATEPDNHKLIIKLARDYATIGQYDNALKTLQPLLEDTQSEWWNSAFLARMDILLRVAFAAPPGSAGRESALSLFRQEFMESRTHIFNDNELRQLAKLAAYGGQVTLAESIVERLVHDSNNLIDLEEAARLALANGNYLKSAQYYWRARELSADPEQKATYIKLALSTLQAGGMGQAGLEWARHLPAAESHRRSVLYVLIKLALASNKPALASDYASKLIRLDSKLAEQPHYIQPHLDIAYFAFMGNGNLSGAMKVAQIAVYQSPDSVVWHERLAQAAEWSGQPQIAIVEWRWLAMHQGDESYWKSWMRLALALYDYQAQISGLERDWRRQGKDREYAGKIVRLYEDLGKPEEALAWLDKQYAESRQPGLLILSAELSARMGNDAGALARYRRYLEHHIAKPDLAATIGAALLRAGRPKEAFKVLERSLPQARPEDKSFWTHYGELAWSLKRHDAAERAYRTLSDAPDAEESHQVRLFQLLKYKDAKLAAQTAEKYWLKNGGIDLFMSAAETYAALNDWQAVQHLYALGEAPENSNYDASLRFVLLRAEMNTRLGNWSAAERDFRFIIMQNPRDTGSKETYLWVLIEAHNFNQLDVIMQQWEKLLADAPGLWDVFAAGYIALGRPGKALALYEHMAALHADDELWLLNYAATLELGGQAKRAAQIRKQIWQKRLNRQTSLDWINTGANAKDIEALRLLLLNDPALGQSILWKLLRDGSAELKQNSQFVELATLWLNEHEQNDASRVWLIRQYAHRLNTTQ